MSDPAAAAGPSPAAPSRGSDTAIGVLGGTGEQGRGLARRLALAGHPVVLGSRDPERAASIAAELGLSNVSGASNEEAAGCPVVIVAVPYAGHRDLLLQLRSQLAGKVVIDCVNPLGFDKQGAYALEVPDGSAALEAAAVLPDSLVAAAFHHVSAVLLLDPAVDRLDTDVLVLGEDRAVTDLVQQLVERIPGMRGVYAGRLRNARQVEALTANLISVNRRYKAHAGIRVTDI